MTTTRHPAAAYLGSIGLLVAVLATHGVEGANPSRPRTKASVASVHRSTGHPALVPHATPSPVASSSYPAYRTPTPCGHGGGCTCAANAQYYGYFPTTWRVWPDEPRPDKAFPQAIGAEPVPHPQGEPPAHLPVEEVQEPEDSSSPQEEIPPGPTAAPPAEPAQPSPSDQPPTSAPSTFTPSTPAPLTPVPSTPVPLTPAPAVQEPSRVPEPTMPAAPAELTPSPPAMPSVPESTIPALTPPVQKKDQNQPPTTLPDGAKSSSQGWRRAGQHALWQPSDSSELRFRAADGPQQASYVSSGSDAEVRILSATVPADSPSSNGLPNLGWHTPAPAAPAGQAQ